MIEYVLDTNTVPELMRGRPNASLESPARRAVHQAWLEQLLTSLVVIPLDSMCAQCHGRERARLARTGRPPSLFDGLIASIAVVNELTLVTHNTANFERFRGIVLEDWF
jgi:predicted nucleic acid-binding protein